MQNLFYNMIKHFVFASYVWRPFNGPPIWNLPMSRRHQIAPNDKMFYKDDKIWHFLDINFFRITRAFINMKTSTPCLITFSLATQNSTVFNITLLDTVTRWTNYCGLQVFNAEKRGLQVFNAEKRIIGGYWYCVTSLRSRSEIKGLKFFCHGFFRK